MQRKEFVGATAAGALGLIASTRAARAGAAPIAASGEATPAMKPLDDFVTGVMRDHEIPCGALAVAKDGRLVYARAFGTRDLAGKIAATPNDRFRIASSSKPLTAVAIMQLVEAGKLHLGDRAFDVLSSFAPPNGTREDPRLRTITVAQLLEHSAGFDSSKTDPQFDALRTAADALGKPRPATHDDIIEYMMGQPLAFDPGSKYVYSNLGYNILGRIVERIAGAPYEASVKATVLAPAGVTRMAIGKSKRGDLFPDEVEAWDPPTFTSMYSVFQDQDEIVPYSYGGFSMETIDAHGGWVASVVDLTRFLNAVGGTSGKQVLAPATVAQMLAKPAIPQYRDKDQWYAFGWNTGGAYVMSHNGAITWGTSSTIGRLPGGLTFGLCYNRLPYDIGAFVAGSAKGAADAINRVTAWPSSDLYPQFA
ncbi:MAG TPA: serine hydrolase domain-containing protein [Candidatus Acidoferrales bacterium]|jgi:N-acyl-D-amino-acid deacylase|nr:serine hydrolase domain-containing protein [Candidatus Acidoferrales bacterium]